DEDVEMAAIFGDGSSESQGVMSRLFGAGARVLTGESLFMTAFTNRGREKQHVAFGAPHPGRIVPMDLAEMGGEIICQKDAFLCAAKGVSVGIAFARKLGVGFFGGEGFILQRLKGSGLAFVHAGGAIVEKTLGASQTLKVDTGCIVAFEPGVHYDIQFVGGLKSAFFGGEGLFFAALSGPGRVWLQSLPFSRLADRIAAAAPRVGGTQKGEGSVLGQLGGMFGDR
ncbi:MAG TPA: TIGR00266 family protein, partial [Vicinamibacteria bacterium]|nr:TIGR00266 family protein [Vicinamibacteria bacterium]